MWGEKKSSVVEKKSGVDEWEKRTVMSRDRRIPKDEQNKKEKNHARKWYGRRYKNRNRGMKI